MERRTPVRRAINEHPVYGTASSRSPRKLCVLYLCGEREFAVPYTGCPPFHIRGVLRSIYGVSSVLYMGCPLPYTGCCHYFTTLTRPSLRGAAGRASLDAYPSDRAPMPIYCSSTPRVFMSCLPSSVWNIWYSRLIQHVARPTA